MEPVLLPEKTAGRAVKAGLLRKEGYFLVGTDKLAELLERLYPDQPKEGK